jgi:hypothetical protein
LPISSRRRGSTGIAITEYLRRITGCGKPSRRWRKGNIGRWRDAATGGAVSGHAVEGCCDNHAKPRSHDTSRIAWAKLMARVGEEFPLEPPPISPARGPPTDWGELVQAHDDRDVFQASPDDLPAIDIHSL